MTHHTEQYSGQFSPHALAAIVCLSLMLYTIIAHSRRQCQQPAVYRVLESTVCPLVAGKAPGLNVPTWGSSVRESRLRSSSQVGRPSQRWGLVGRTLLRWNPVPRSPLNVAPLLLNEF